MKIRMMIAGDDIQLTHGAKDSVEINGQAVWDGTLGIGDSATFSHRRRSYTICRRPLNRWLNASMYEISISEDGKLLHAAVFDRRGKVYPSREAVTSEAKVQTCSIVGAVGGFATMMILNAVTRGSVPGGALGGAIGAGGGALFGLAVGKLLVPKNRRS